MQKVQGMQSMSLSNILLSEKTGYDNPTSGKINFLDGGFALYARLEEASSTSGDLNPHIEIDENYCVEFSELPCDAEGNIVLDSYALTRLKKTTTPYLGVNFYQLTLICSKEPTHRVNVLTGALVKNTSDSQYLTDIHFNCINAKY